MIVRKLTGRQLAFVLHWAQTGNKSEAYRQAYNCLHWKDATIWSKASELSRNSLVLERYEQLQDEVSKAVVIDRAAVIDHITSLALANAHDLSAIEVRNCRHCSGIGHRYHWASPTEFAFRCAEVMDRNAKLYSDWELGGSQGNAPVPQDLPTDEGGYGYIVNNSPNPECPKCLGEGHVVPTIKDTRFIKGAAKKLYAGFKQTQYGIELKTRDQDKMVELLGRIHGIYKDPILPAGSLPAAPPGQVVVISDDPLLASRTYQELMRGES